MKNRGIIPIRHESRTQAKIWLAKTKEEFL